MAIARAANASDPELVFWTKDSRPVSFERGSPPCSFPGRVWRRHGQQHYNLLCSLDGRGRWARYESVGANLTAWRLSDENFLPNNSMPSNESRCGHGHRFNSGPFFLPVPNTTRHMVGLCQGQELSVSNMILTRSG